MIVALTGSHGTGKSTLVDRFRTLEGFVCIDSVTRSSTTAEERRVEETDLNQAQLKIAENIVEKMTEIIKENEANPDKVYLLDRSVVDFLSYCQVFVSEGRLTIENFGKVNAMCKKFINNIVIRAALITRYIVDKIMCFFLYQIEEKTIKTIALTGIAMINDIQAFSK